MRYLYDNFLHAEDFNRLAEVVSGEGFAWYARVGAVGVDNEDKDPAFSNVLCNEFGPTRQEFEHVIPLLRKLNLTATMRIKANLDLPNKNGKVLEPESFHTDIDVHAPGIWTLVFYLNNCNGGTVFEEDMAPIKSKANRAIIFPTHMRHSGCHQTDTPFRYVINLNYVAKDLPEGGQEF